MSHLKRIGLKQDLVKSGMPYRPAIHGLSLNPRVMAARLALAEKGVGYDFVEPEFLSATGFRLNEIMRQFCDAMPTLVEGSVVLYDLEAILRFIDEGFPGPALQPATAAGRAVMVQLMAIERDLLHPCAVGRVASQKVFGPMLGRESEEASLSGVVERLGEIFSVIENISLLWTGKPNGEWLMGATPTLADLQLAPIVHLLLKTEEGRAAISGSERITSWWGRVCERSWLMAVMQGTDSDN